MSYQRYRLDSEALPPKPMDIQLLYITMAQYRADLTSVLHTHSFTELFFILSGEGKLVINQELFSVKANDLIFINPDVPHMEYGNQTHQLEYIVLGIKGLQFQFTSENTPNPPYSIQSLASCREEILFYLQRMLREVHNEAPYYRQFCHSLLECLLYYLIRQTKNTFAFHTTSKVLRECLIAENYMNTHFSEEITLQTLSEVTHMNKYYLAHIFQEYKGIAPINYLIQRRIQEAANLLETSNLNISIISQQVGFSSQSYFSKIFQKKMGCTPREYRKKKR